MLPYMMALWLLSKTAGIFASRTQERSNERPGAKMMFFSQHYQRILPLTGYQTSSAFH